MVGLVRTVDGAAPGATVLRMVSLGLRSEWMVRNMAIRWDLLEAQGIKRSGNAAKGDPRKFIIAGLDIPVDELIAKFEGDPRAQEIIYYGARDEARLRVPLPPGFVEGFEDSSPVAIYFTQLIDKSGKSWPLVTDGRSRCIAMRHWADEHAKAKAPVRTIDAEIDTFSKNNVGLKALRSKLFRNRHIPDGVGVLGERAADFKRLGYSIEDTAREMAVEPADVTKYLKWNDVFDNLCAEAQQRAIKGDLRLGAAVRLSKLGKTEQKERLEGKRAKASVSARQLSPRTIDLFADEIKKSLGKDGDVMVPAGVILRLVNGDRSAAKDLIGTARAAWLKAEEAAKKKPRAK